MHFVHFVTKIVRFIYDRDITTPLTQKRCDKMELKKNIAKTGNSLCVIIPRDIAEGLGWSYDDPILLLVEDKTLTIKKDGEDQ